jgi:hypothetical protein
MRDDLEAASQSGAAASKHAEDKSCELDQALDSLDEAEAAKKV